MLAELHCHSHYSTGKKILLEGLDSPEKMVRYAKKIGLDIIAITDHDTIKGGIEARRFAKKHGIIGIVGEEIKTRKGDVIALGIEEEIQKNLSFEETLELIHEQGGIAIAPHPFDVRGAGIGLLAKHCDATEIFNALNVERISNIKVMRFAKKNSLSKIAGSDAHCKEMLGYGVTNVDVDTNNVDNILKAIKHDKTSLRTKYIPTKIIMEWGVKRLKYSYNFTLNYINTNYGWPKRYVCEKLLNLVNYSPGKIDYVFRLISYFALGNVFLIRAIREILRI